MAKYTELFDPISERGHRDTPKGMAHWAGTGPKGETCRTCRRFRTDGYFAASNSQKANQLKPGICRLYANLVKGQPPRIQPRNAACKHFELNTRPPALVFGRAGRDSGISA